MLDTVALTLNNVNKKLAEDIFNSVSTRGIYLKRRQKHRKWTNSISNWEDKKSTNTIGDS